MTYQHHLDRINALTRTSRTAWFALLVALVFVGVTLMSVEHIDFYGVDRATRLPVFAVDVPTRYFFVAAPILIAAIHCYLHLYLIRLSEALGKAPARVDGVRLGDAVAPWLITDAALHFRRWRRGNNSAAPRTLERISSVLNVILAWGLGPLVLFALFRFSLPARDFWITATAGALLCVGLMSCFASLDAMYHALRAKDGARQTSAFKPKTAFPNTSVRCCYELHGNWGRRFIA